MRFKNETSGPIFIPGQMNFIFRARMLWRDLATWMPIYMVSTLGGYQNQAAVAERMYDRILAFSSVIGDYFSEGILNYLTLPGPARPIQSDWMRESK